MVMLQLFSRDLIKEHQNEGVLTFIKKPVCGHPHLQGAPVTVQVGAGDNTHRPSAVIDAVHDVLHNVSTNLKIPVMDAHTKERRTVLLQAGKKLFSDPWFIVCIVRDKNIIFIMLSVPLFMVQPTFHHVDQVEDIPPNTFIEERCKHEQHGDHKGQYKHDQIQVSVTVTVKERNQV